MKAVANQQKKDTVKQIVELIDSYPMIGVVNVESLPARNLAAMRKSLRGKAHIFMAKKRIISMAFAQAKKSDVNKLESHFKGMPALLFTKDNPFSIFKTLKKNQSKAPIKAGQVAPNDLVVPAGPTSFPPGPIIGELGQLGIQGGVEDGKVVIKADAVLVKEGDVCDDKRAAFLTRMGIEPMRIGLNLVAMYEEGTIYDNKTLDVDEEAFMNDLQTAVVQARNLAMDVGYPTKDTIELMIQVAHMDATGLAYEQDILTDSNTEELLAKAHWQATGLNEKIPDAPAAATEEKTEEAPKEEAKEETPEQPAEEKEEPKETEEKSE